jgi:archaetidylinositol phosphate synthase
MGIQAVLPTAKPVFTAAKRVHGSLTASIERRVLMWMAERMPRWVTSDGLTIFGFAAQIAAGISYVLARYNRYALLLVIVCMALNWFGDSMDGTLARVRNQPRPRFGFYVDHMIDVLGSVALMGGLALSGFVHWQVAIAMLIAFLLLSCESFLATYTLSRFELSQGLFGPTEIRILLIVGNLALLHSAYSTVLGRTVLLFDLGGTIATVCIFAMVMVLAVRHTAELYQAEPLP